MKNLNHNLDLARLNRPSFLEQNNKQDLILLDQRGNLHFRAGTI